MTRIAIISDIHGNLPALEAVMADLEYTAPDRVIVDGDVVNRGPQSKPCLDRVREMGWLTIFGNHEEYVLKFNNGDVPAEWYSDWWLPTRHVAESELTAADLDYFRTLPRSHVVTEPGLPALRIVHGSPRHLNEGIGPWLDDGELLELSEGVPEPVLIGAHTHRTLDRRVGSRWFLNCGAVGAPFNGNPDAQYLLLTARAGAWHAEFRSVPYDHAPLYAAWEATGYMDRSMIAQIFRLEVETAHFHLGIYLEFCEQRGLAQNDPRSFQQYCGTIRHATP